MKKILIYSILLFALCSCDNFLEEDPRGQTYPFLFLLKSGRLGYGYNWDVQQILPD